MRAGKSLKEQNAWLIRAVLAVHALAFLYVAFEPLPIAQFSDPGFMKKVQGFLAPGSISLGLIALVPLVLFGIISPKWRDRCIHWGWNNPLPGARAFTQIGPADARVDMKKLGRTYGTLPTDPGKQSRLFYSIYKSYANDVGVLDAHKSYLAARDIATINLLFFVILPPLAWWATKDIGRVLIYAGALLAAYVIMCVAAKIYGTRLVQNSLAVASARR